MNWILCGVLCALGGLLGWMVWEFRAIRKMLQARQSKEFSMDKLLENMRVGTREAMKILPEERK